MIKSLKANNSFEALILQIYLFNNENTFLLYMFSHTLSRKKCNSFLISCKSHDLLMKKLDMANENAIQMCCSFKIWLTYDYI